MEITKPRVKEVAVRWTGKGLSYRGTAPDRPEIPIDAGDSREGPSPMDALLMGVAACMAADVLEILRKSRVPLTGLTVEAKGFRADQPPRVFTRIELVYVLEGPDPSQRPQVERAIRLSRDTYCSALNTLRPDIELEVEIRGL